MDPDLLLTLASVLASDTAGDCGCSKQEAVAYHSRKKRLGPQIADRGRKIPSLTIRS